MLRRGVVRVLEHFCWTSILTYRWAPIYGISVIRVIRGPAGAEYRAIMLYPPVYHLFYPFEVPRNLAIRGREWIHNPPGIS
jgi:hypothetical protein